MSKQSAQEIQDAIFKKMTASRKLEVGAGLWKLGRELVGDKIHYGPKRSTAIIGKNRKNP